MGGAITVINFVFFVASRPPGTVRRTGINRRCHNAELPAQPHGSGGVAREPLATP